jgi:L-ascorbate metabolism protein UlaG (beta-lactamase superfamily)
MTGSSGRMTWVGHATVLLDLSGVRLLTDPLLRGRLWHLRRHGAPPSSDMAERLDAVLLSHLHFDHLDVPSLRRIGRDVTLLAPRGAGPFLRRLGFSRVAEMGPGDRVAVGGVAVTAVRAAHDGRRRPLGPVAETIGFVVDGGPRVYFAGDTELFDGIEHMAPTLDVALLPVWGWGPALGAGHMDPCSAAQAAARLRPGLAVPIHWGTFFPAGLARLRGRALVEPPLAFRRLVGELAPEVEVRVLAPGQSTALRTSGAAGSVTGNPTPPTDEPRLRP